MAVYRDGPLPLQTLWPKADRPRERTARCGIHGEVPHELFPLTGNTPDAERRTTEPVGSVSHRRGLCFPARLIQPAAPGHRATPQLGDEAFAVELLDELFNVTPSPAELSGRDQIQCGDTLYGVVGSASG